MIGTVAPAPGLALYLYTMLKSSYELGAGWYFVISVDEELIEKFPTLQGIRAIRVFEGRGEDAPTGWIGVVPA